MPERNRAGWPSPPPKLAVVGQGYVGLPISMRAVEAGYHVVGIDIDDGRLDRLAAGTSYVGDISDAAVADAMATGQFAPSRTYDAAAGFDYAIITVPTPLRDGLPDLDYIEQAAAGLSPHVQPGCTVVLESTTYPGTTDELLVPVLENSSGLKAGIDFYVGYSPERIDPGNSTYGFVNIPKVIAGINEASLAQVRALYESLVDAVVAVSTCKVAELTKLLENTFRHVNIALVNELAMFAHDLGIDLWEAIDASSTKPFGYMRFTPGPGVGGHCLPVDPSYLSWQVKRTLGTPFRFVELANDVNDHMPDYVTRRIIAMLNDACRPVRDSRILLVGVSYKKNTPDVRESPALRVAELLRELGALVHYADPHVDHCEIRDALGGEIAPVELTKEEVAGADLVVLLTDHDAFDYTAMDQAVPVLDCRRRLAPAPHVNTL